jgi:hypothetical protein
MLVDNKLSVPDNYSSNIVCLNFKDILVNKQLVLSTLSNITGKEISEHVHRNYDRYVDIQNQIYQKYVSQIISA